MKFPQSRYDWARCLQIAGLVLFFGAMLLLGVVLGRRAPLLGFAICLIGLILMMAARQICCPNCGKSLMVSYFGLKPGNPLRAVAFRNNWLPERVCSDCGHTLDRTAGDEH